jgi:kumamolisin
MNQPTTALPSSAPVIPAQASRIGPPSDQDVIEVSVYLKPHAAPEAAAAVNAAAPKVAELAAGRAAEHADDITAVKAYAAQHGLKVISVEPVRRLVKLSGTAAAMEAAFATQLGTYQSGPHQFRSHEGPIHVSEDLSARVQAVLGLDNRPIVEPRMRIATPHVLTGHLPNAVGTLYDFPANVNGAGQVIAILEFGGGYNDADNAQAFQAMGLALPTIVTVSVDGATNQPGSGADGEVALDIQVAGGVAPGATLAVYFAPNSVRGFADAISQAATDAVYHPKVISISWGSAEMNWGLPAMTVINDALQDAATLQASVFVASGDNLGNDGLANNRANVDFPSSSPFAIGCGGTEIDTNGGTITTEVVWNSGGEGTGGGVSDFFAVPAFQTNTALPPSVNDGQRRRSVPDVAADASPNSPYLIVLNGQVSGFGGTSAVAPLWAGLTALLNQNAGKPIGFCLPTLYANAGAFRQITQGNNIPAGTNFGYNAGPGYNACTGLGVPDGTALAGLFPAASPQPALVAV